MIIKRKISYFSLVYRNINDDVIKDISGYSIGPGLYFSGMNILLYTREKWYSVKGRNNGVTSNFFDNKINKIYYLNDRQH